MAQQTAHDFDAKPRTLDVQLTTDLDFESMFLPDLLLKGLKDCGFKKPSPIQVKAIPLARCGFDLIVHAKSGTGKTLVFSLMILECVKISVKRVQSLVITPTREIALQITDVLRALGVYLKGLRVGTLIGGRAVAEDQKSLVGCQVAVGCPGRVRHLLEMGALDPKAVRLLVLDEADQLMDDSFLEDVRLIVRSVNKTKQLLACSATLSPRLSGFMEEEAAEGVGTATPDSPGGGGGGGGGGSGLLLLGLRHFVFLLPHHPDPLARLMHKQQALLHILSTLPFDQAIVFSNYFSRAESICNVLNKKGWSGTWLAGKQEQEARTEAVGRLKCGEVRVLVATDVAARGLDAHGVNLVVNMDVPCDPRTYLHRAGRAGRYGSHGLVISIVSEGAEEEGFRRILGRIGGAAMRVGVICRGGRSDLWSVEDRELEQMHGIPPAEESEDSGRESEAEGAAGGSDAEADRAHSKPRRKRKKDRRSASLKNDPPSRSGSNKKVKFANVGTSGYCRSAGWRGERRTERGVRDLVAGLRRMSTGGDSPGRSGGEGGGRSRRNKRKLSGGASESEEETTSSASTSCSEGEYVLSEPRSPAAAATAAAAASAATATAADLPPPPLLDGRHFRDWYTLWHDHNLKLRRYIDYYRYFNPN